MTGIVFWKDNSEALNALGNTVQLEFTYLVYGDYCTAVNQCDWQAVDNLLNDIASRGHQAILRFRYTYPGVTKVSVPLAITQQAGYESIISQVEGRNTFLPDWSHPPLEDFTLWFFEAFASRYDGDPRLAFMQMGFGSYSEYHLYDGPLSLGNNFPSKAFQATLLTELDENFKQTPWTLSIDAASSTRTPFSSQSELKDLTFGLFDDSFMHSEHSDDNNEYNRASWLFFDEQRFKSSPAGGEFSYYSDYDQQNVLTLPNGPHGRNFESFAAQYHITYIIGNDQYNHQTPERIKEAAKATGYAFHIDNFEASTQQSRITVSNQGVAPIYYDAYITVNGVRATKSLKGLQPNESAQFLVEAGGAAPDITITSDALLNEQEIQFSADL